ncbi:MAG: cobaltochelatase CobT-related protein [Gemmataceae bacterium]
MTPATQLGALAAGLCQDAGIRVELSERTWAWDPLRRVILVAEDDLKAKGPVYCAAVLAHEVSHYFISRYHLIPLEFSSTQALPHLLNSIEDPRVNTWIRQRYPGTGRWLQELTRADSATPIKVQLPDFILFCLECAREELRAWAPLPENVLPLPVATALHRSRPARMEYAATLPPPDLNPREPDAELLERYRLEVWPALIPRAQLDLPTRREQNIRLSVLNALRVAEAQILPIAAELLERDLSRLSNWLRADWKRQQAAESTLTSGTDEQLRGLFFEALASPPGDGKMPPAVRDLALRTFDAWLRSTNESRGGGCGTRPLISGSCPGTARPGSGRPAGGKRAARPFRGRPGQRRPLRLPPPDTLYERAYAKVADQVQHLAQSLDDLLRPRRRLREIAGYPSGHRLDLRRVMAFEADPRVWHQLWLRKSIPHRRRTAIELLVDLSGSMRGPKTDAAVAGTVLLAETLHRLQVPFAVHGFQDVLIPFCNFDEGLTARMRDAIGEMPHEVDGSRKGGNNNPSYNDDGPCVREAAGKLLDTAADDRILIVVSDGLPEGRHSNEKDLRDAITEVSADPALKLIGVGLGPDTGHVSQFYPHSIANVPVGRFAAEIARLLRGILA